MVFAEEELELVTGGADGTFLVWRMPNLVLKQRFTRLNASPLVSRAPGMILAIEIQNMLCSISPLPQWRHVSYNKPTRSFCLF